MPSTRCPDEIDLDCPPRGYLRRRKTRHSHKFGWSLQVCGYDVDILVNADYAVLPGMPGTLVDPPEAPMVEDAAFAISFDGGKSWADPGDMFAEALAEDERVQDLLLDAAGRE